MLLFLLPMPMLWGTNFEMFKNVEMLTGDIRIIALEMRLQHGGLNSTIINCRREVTSRQTM